MPFDLHIVEVVDAASTQVGNGLQNVDKVVLAKLDSVTNAAGGSAGTAVTTAVAFANELPADYAVFVQPGQDATAYVSSKTATGFNVVLTPRLATATIAAGSFDVLVVA